MTCGRLCFFRLKCFFLARVLTEMTCGKLTRVGVRFRPLGLALLWLLAAISPQPRPAAAGDTPGHPTKRPIRFNDLPADFRLWFEQQGLGAEGFERSISSIERKTTERETLGEYDHLIHFLLQSASFTAEPRVEPALSAYEFVGRLTPAEKDAYLAEGAAPPPVGRMPASAARRLGDFIRALGRPAGDERLAYFRTFLHKQAAPPEPLAVHLSAAYARAMRFLYRKEFLSRQFSRPEDLAAFVATLYQGRGHSTDTQIEANYAVYTALSVVRAQAPATQLNRILIVGPGLDFAPRTDLIDASSPQSYQPFAVADALLGLKLADPARLRIHCVDINDRVIDYVSRVSGGEAHLTLISGVPETDARPLDAGYRTYFRFLGQSIGAESPPPAGRGLAGRLLKSLRVRAEVTARLSAAKLNLVTERYDPSPNYDLILVTNVFPYFDANELLLALTNVEAMLAGGGYLIHNERRAIVTSLTRTLGLPATQTRTVLIAASPTVPIFDGVTIHQKTLH